MRTQDFNAIHRYVLRSTSENNAAPSSGTTHIIGVQIGANLLCSQRTQLHNLVTGAVASGNNPSRPSHRSECHPECDDWWDDPMIDITGCIMAHSQKCIALCRYARNTIKSTFPLY